MSNARARDLNIQVPGTPGPLNAITDVKGVEVGHCTIVEGEDVRTGVTSIFPKGKQGARTPVPGGFYSLNGNGEMTGTIWLDESGFFEGPIALTNTHSVGVVRDAVISWTVKHFGESDENAFCLPVVAETYDGFLNDINGMHVRREHVFAALDAAAGGVAPAEGSVGGGTGMITHEFKGGIGSSSRVVDIGHDVELEYTVGVLVQSNYGKRDSLTVTGVPVGQYLTSHMPEYRRGRTKSRDGSIIVVVATDAPLLPHQLKRLARRVPLGLARLGALSANSSGDIFIAFSTQVPGSDDSGIETWRAIPNHRMDPLFKATIEATEEAILNALLAGETMTGVHGSIVYGLPVNEMLEVLRQFGRLS